ncbi:hypothetical protein [Nocardia brasiliensis]|uniref:Uncharacterized protein n=1 Tax=Nocardia brasiliensis (strain ATCC 700358 / HUJEG-1) TaxID=1133849 RepID=K0EFU9_NOCB7|nr:hypothetical protein [Nocardia brasiliensis]AFT98087.1 hypothetical protein O3I_000625 [Nocardia brasiliensis ATCC 700358]OCF90779.1 hypothetical protein AW168_07905 [Nocardia brasiliensis]
MVSPQYPSGYNPYPGYPGVVPAPSSATAITAGVLACVGAFGQLLGGAVNLVFGIVDIGHELGEYDATGLLGQSWYRTFALTSGVAAMLSAVLLGVGAIGLLRRKQFGRMLVVVGCAVVIVLGIVSFALVQSAGGSWDSSLGLSTGISGLVTLLFPVGTAALALVPATTRWLAHTPAAYPYAPPPGAPWTPQPWQPPYPNQSQPQPNWQATPAIPTPGEQPAWGAPGNQAAHSPWAAPAPNSPTPPPAGAPAPSDQPPAHGQPSWGAPEAATQAVPAWATPGAEAPTGQTPPATWGPAPQDGRSAAAPRAQSDSPAQHDDSAWQQPSFAKPAPPSPDSDGTVGHPPSA